MPWRVAIQHPRDPEAFLGTVMLHDGQSAATSGDYQRYYELNGIRYHHILDPQTGQPSRLHQSVTVIAPSAWTLIIILHCSFYCQQRKSKTGLLLPKIWP